MRHLLLLILLLSFFDLYACSCNPPKGEINNRLVEKYDIIFKGVVLKVDTLYASFSKNVTFKISTLYKGSVQSDTVVVNTMLEEGACGLNVEINEEWLLFANLKENSFFTSLCTRSSDISGKWPYRKELIKADLEFLERIRTERK